VPRPRTVTFIAGPLDGQTCEQTYGAWPAYRDEKTGEKIRMTKGDLMLHVAMVEPGGGSHLYVLAEEFNREGNPAPRYVHSLIWPIYLPGLFTRQLLDGDDEAVSRMAGISKLSEGEVRRRAAIASESHAAIGLR
jgi:hypothetical protein